jgi:hypothetical protein
MKVEMGKTGETDFSEGQNFTLSLFWAGWGESVRERMTSCVQRARRINLLLLFVSKLSRDLKLFVRCLRPAPRMFFLASRVQYQAPKVWSKAPKCRTRVANSIFADLFIKVSSLAQVLRGLLLVSPLIRCTMKNYAVDRGRGVLIAHDPQGRGV